MKTVIEDAQDKCQRSSRLAYDIKDKEDRGRLNDAVSNVYFAIRKGAIPMLVDRVKYMDAIDKELRR